MDDRITLNTESSHDANVFVNTGGTGRCHYTAYGAAKDDKLGNMAAIGFQLM